jgi:N-methylhydantoinase B/oxoprolinase/acetone carboxylase alpha subunit
MSNLLFGDRQGNFVHYETLACGAGAGPAGPGADAIQTHMTNTLNTPIERLEQCFPVQVEGYALAAPGKGNGGRGVVRTLRFLAPVILSLSGERRSQAPWGLHGGADGTLGRQVLIDSEGVEIQLPGKMSLPVTSGTRLRLESPGGGAWQAWSKSNVLAMSTAPEEDDDRGTDRA